MERKGQLMHRVRDAIWREYCSVRSARTETQMCAAHVALTAGLAIELLVRVHGQLRCVVRRVGLPTSLSIDPDRIGAEHLRVQGNVARLVACS